MSWLKFKTSGKLSIILEEFREYTHFDKEKAKDAKMEPVGLGNRSIMSKNLPAHWDGVTFDMKDLSVCCVTKSLASFGRRQSGDCIIGATSYTRPVTIAIYVVLCMKWPLLLDYRRPATIVLYVLSLVERTKLSKFTPH